MVLNVGMYLLGERIGQESAGTVRLGTHKETGDQYAVKMLDKSVIRANKASPEVKREIAAMSTIKHRNIVRLHEVLSSPSKLYLVMELVRGTDLNAHLARSSPLHKEDAKSLFRQLCAGLAYCHARGVFHGALTAENVLITENDDLKITGFGVFNPSDPDRAQDDAFACGKLLVQLLAGEKDFDENERDLIAALTADNPAERPTLAAAANHPWLTAAEVVHNRDSHKFCNNREQHVLAELLAPERVSLMTTMDALGPPPSPISPSRSPPAPRELRRQHPPPPHRVPVARPTSPCSPCSPASPRSPQQQHSVLAGHESMSESLKPLSPPPSGHPSPPQLSTSEVSSEARSFDAQQVAEDFDVQPNPELKRAVQAILPARLHRRARFIAVNLSRVGFEDVDDLEFVVQCERTVPRVAAFLEQRTQIGPFYCLRIARGMVERTYVT